MICFFFNLKMELFFDVKIPKPCNLICSFTMQFQYDLSFKFLFDFDFVFQLQFKLTFDFFVNFDI